MIMRHKNRYNGRQHRVWHFASYLLGLKLAGDLVKDFVDAFSLSDFHHSHANDAIIPSESYIHIHLPI